jgi:hypothetical protein
LTHISHLLDTHKGIKNKLPLSVEPAYDGLKIKMF